MDYTVRESGLRLDQPPAVGDISSVAVVILKNDNVEGILEFKQDYVNITGKTPNKQGQFETLQIYLAVSLKCEHTFCFWCFFIQLRRMLARCCSQL